MKNLARILLLSLLSTGICCTGKPDIDLAGTWRGQWTAGVISGSLEITFGGKRSFGDMTLYDVTLVATGPSCTAGGDRGTGDRTVAFNQSDVRFVVSVAAGPAGDGVFQFIGALNGGGEIDGSYRLSSDSCPGCTCAMGSSGTWTVLR